MSRDPRSNYRRFKSMAGVVFGCLFSISVVAVEARADAGADASADASATSNNKASENYYKDKEFLPGEEVVTPTGQKMKVWSTQGPVKVSKAPEPFEDREKSVLKNNSILLDARSGVNAVSGGQSKAAAVTPPTEKTAPSDNINVDTFDHRPNQAAPVDAGGGDVTGAE